MSPPVSDATDAQNVDRGALTVEMIERRIAELFQTESPDLAKSGPQRPYDWLQEIYKEGRYRNLGVLNKGGTSTILQIWDCDFDRKLALKVLSPEVSAHGALVAPCKGAMARFANECTITAQLSHPSVAPVFDLGFDQHGLPFFTMQQVVGRNLTEIFKMVQRRLKGWTPDRGIAVLIQACKAMEYANVKGVVHRDLKPDNIMVGQFGEVYVMDWGLAKNLRRHQSVDTEGNPRGEPAKEGDLSIWQLTHTTEGTVFGTPAYMSPEQAEGRVSAIDHRSDVYSLGAILYTLLAMQHPFEDLSEKSGVDLIQAIAKDRPSPILEHNPAAPKRLVEICAKAMARDTTERHPSTGRLGDELQDFLEHHSRSDEPLDWARAPLAARLKNSFRSERTAFDPAHRR